jgi:methylmalonyl-CoA mutase
MLENLQATWRDEAPDATRNLKEAATKNLNIFESLMEATKVCSIGQITRALFEVGGQYRRNM